MQVLTFEATKSGDFLKPFPAPWQSAVDPADPSGHNGKPARERTDWTGPVGSPLPGPGWSWMAMDGHGHGHSRVGILHLPMEKGPFINDLPWFYL